MPRIKPTPFNLFCAYFLGMNQDVESEFFNINSLAEATGIYVDDLIRLMEKMHLDAPTMRHVPFNVSKAHADCQDLIMDGKPQEALQVARKYFDEYFKLLKEYDENLNFETIDYDNIWGDEHPELPRD